MLSMIALATLTALAADARYVAASSLNLRAEPGGTRIGHLAINSPVEVLETRDDQARVRAGNGKTGWVPTRFLDDAPLAFADTLERARGAQDAETRLSLAQRATALAPRDKEALTLLAAAYRALGRDREAAKVDQQLAWPQDLLPAGAHPPTDEGWLRLEFGTTVGLGRQAPVRQGGTDRALTAAEMERLGVAPGDPVWVLPTRSAAVQGTVKGMQARSFNECADSDGVVLVTDAVLPDGEEAIAFTRAAPPSAWARAIEVRDSARDHVPTEDRGELTVSVVPEAGGGSLVRVRSVRASAEDVPTWTVEDYVVTGTEATRRDTFTSQGYLGPRMIISARDIDGDGIAERVESAGCDTIILDADGVQRAASAPLCCGC